MLASFQNPFTVILPVKFAAKLLHSANFQKYLLLEMQIFMKFSRGETFSKISLKLLMKNSRNLQINVDTEQ